MYALLTVDYHLSYYDYLSPETTYVCLLLATCCLLRTTYYYYYYYILPTTYYLLPLITTTYYYLTYHLPFGDLVLLTPACYLPPTTHYYLLLFRYLESKGRLFIGSGVSGGEEGARTGTPPHPLTSQHGKVE